MHPPKISFNQRPNLTVSIVIGSLLLLIAAALAVSFFVAGSTAKSFNAEVSDYATRSKSVLAGKDFKNDTKIQELVNSAPELAWIPFGGFNPEYRSALSQQAALEYYTAKTISVTTHQQDTTYRDKVSAITKEMMKKYSNNVSDYSDGGSSKAKSFEDLKKADIAYFDKQITTLTENKTKISTLQTNSFSAPLQEYAVTQIDKTLAALNDRKTKIADATDSSVYARLSITSQFENNRSTYYLYRISSLTNSMYYYSWRDVLQTQIDQHLITKSFTGSDKQVAAAAALAYDTRVYKTYIPDSFTNKSFDAYSMIAKYHAYLLRRTLDASDTPNSMKKDLRNSVQAIVADSETIAFDIQYSNELVSISGVVNTMFNSLQNIDRIVNDGKNIDEGRQAIETLLAKYPQSEYYKSTSDKISQVFKKCFDIRLTTIELENNRDKIRESISDKVKSDKDIAAMTDTFKQLREAEDKISKQRDVYNTCLSTIDPILKEFADKQNAYADFKKSLVAHADRLTSEL